MRCIMSLSGEHMRKIIFVEVTKKFNLFTLILIMIKSSQDRKLKVNPDLLANVKNVGKVRKAKHRVRSSV